MHPFFEEKNSGNQNFFSSAVFANFSFPPHLHPYVEIVYVVEGTMEVTVNGHATILNVGDVAVCFPNDIHGYTNRDYSKIQLLIFSPEITSSYFSKRMNTTLENPFIPSSLINGELSSLFFKLHNEFNKNNNEYVIKGFLYTILGKLDAFFTLKKSNLSYNNTTQNLLKYIEGHFLENITLESIATALGFSKFYLSRIFSNKIGYQFNDYLNRLRINKAQQLLSETDKTVTNIALECGFESQRNFNRIFKELISLTPTEFRDRESREKDYKA
jgi:AraC-like DNA-binding protein